jgi:L-threonylcarbamoyladenylate synthase
MLLDGLAAASIARAAQALAAGQLVAFPTETVYGLGAHAESDVAVAQIFTAKGRPSDHPLIVHIASSAAAEHFAASIPEFARRLMQAFWPGPLTLIVPRRAGVAGAAAGSQATIGLRCPQHAVAQALLHACAQMQPPVLGLAAPSANRFGRLSPTTAAHVQAEFSAGPGDDLLVLDGGPCAVGIESTIVDCTRGAPVLLRPGWITPAQIEAACGQVMADNLHATAPRASGTLQAHYAPQAKLRLMSAKALQTALDLLGPDAAHIAIYARVVLRTQSTRIATRRMPDDAQACAQQLFAVLREFDAQGVRLIWVETPPDGPEWQGVLDRLTRAAAA